MKLRIVSAFALIATVLSHSAFAVDIANLRAFLKSPVAFTSSQFSVPADCDSGLGAEVTFKQEVEKVLNSAEHKLRVAQGDRFGRATLYYSESMHTAELHIFYVNYKGEAFQPQTSEHAVVIPFIFKPVPGHHCG
jgi:hypothetical protein